MASQMKSWKLQQLVAHDANVNCLALGHKSGRVMVTGGDDKKVNLWAIGKQACFMSLGGHTSPIECVQFNPFEVLACSGSRSGALKVWDLEATKLVRTLNGHKNAIKCTDFHPYEEFLASGGSDSCIKLWDSRKKGCIFTYNGHKSTVNSLKFSPDGHWIASGGDDASVKIWDLRVGRVLKTFNEHLNSVTCVEFHPDEFLLGTGSADRNVCLFDLENFNVVSIEKDLGLVRCLCFNPDGEKLYVGVRDYLKVVGWEPSRLFDSVPVNWSRVCDISITQNQLVGASYHLNNVQVFIVDLNKINPCDSQLLDNNVTSRLSLNQSFRKSFSKAERPVSLKNRTSSLNVAKTIEESTSGTDPEEDSIAEVTNRTDYNEIFQGRGLCRTPPPLEPEPFQRPENESYDPTEPQILAELTTENFEALSLDNCVSSTPLTSTQYQRSKSNLDQVYVSKLGKQQDRENILPTLKKPKVLPKAATETAPQNLTTPRFYLQRQSSCKDVPEPLPKPSSIKHSVSEASLTKPTIPIRNISSRKNSFSRTNNINSNTTKIPLNSGRSTDRNENKNDINTYVKVPPICITNNTVDLYENNKPTTPPTEKSEIVPIPLDRPIGLDVNDFIPKNHRNFSPKQQLSDMSESEALGALMRGHEPMIAMITTRQRNFKLVMAQFRSKGIKVAAETAISMEDLATLVDILGVINHKYTLWDLDLCVLVLPKIQELLQNKFEKYLTTGCNTLKVILRHFGPVIRNNVQSSVGSFGVDITREERYKKSLKCHETLKNLRSFMVKKSTMPGSLGSTFKEVVALMQNTLD